MEVFEIRRFDLLGRDEEHLRQRLATFCRAVQLRTGAILEVRWAPQRAQAQCGASVVYELPVSAGASAPTPEHHGGPS